MSFPILRIEFAFDHGYPRQDRALWVVLCYVIATASATDDPPWSYRLKAGLLASFIQQV